MGPWTRTDTRRTTLKSLTPFESVSAAGGAVIALSGVFDALSPRDGGFNLTWTLFWVLATVVVTGVPLALRDRFPLWAGLAGALVFYSVTALQMSVSTNPFGSVNNLVLYPMIACYVGWFFSRRTSRLSVLFAIVASGVAVVVNPVDSLGLTWANITLASVFCLEATGFLHAKLDQQATTDPLTGALNRRGLDQRLSIEIERSLRTAVPLTIAVVDIDDFKAVNDRFGHSAGDRRLQRFVASIVASTRHYDAVVRTGGDEFLLIFPGTTEDEARELMIRLESTTEEQWSFGLAVAKADDTPQAMRDRADARMYVHKRERKLHESE